MSGSGVLYGAGMHVAWCDGRHEGSGTATVADSVVTNNDAADRPQRLHSVSDCLSCRRLRCCGNAFSGRPRKTVGSSSSTNIINIISSSCSSNSRAVPCPCRVLIQLGTIAHCA